jgi:cytosolic carboxypeptidase protein 2/3
MMQGLLKYLVGDSHQARELRKRIVFKVIPMTNPDGVIAGNYRTGMEGHDLNRRYIEPDSRLHPTVCAIK